MVENLSKKPGKMLKRLEGKNVNLESPLEKFVTSRSRILFDHLGVEGTLFEKHPSTWKDDNEYKIAVKRAQSLKVVNDAAERGIALIQKYNDSTKCEEQKKLLLQLVHHHRQLMPKKTKKELMTKKM